MKTIGLIGGMTWESTLLYYRIINETLNKKLGGLHSAKCIIYSLDFEEIEKSLIHGNWGKIEETIIKASQKLEKAGADLIVICTNTIHKIADNVQKGIDIPLINIIDATGESIIERGINRIGLLGTKFTMEEDFYKKRLKEKFKLMTLVPLEKDREIIHKIILEELSFGKINKSSKSKIKKIINDLILKGAQGIILGCTELPILIGEKDIEVPFFNTTKIHAEKAVKYALES